MDEKLPDESCKHSKNEKGLTALEAIKRHLQHSSPSSLRDAIAKKLEADKDGTSGGAAEATA